MSKKKNTLKDLDEFLKQQAASIVEPTKLGLPSDENENKEVHVQEKTSNDFEHLIKQFKVATDQEGKDFRESLYNFIIQSIESLDQSTPEDKMLINTVLYLKSGDQWKEVIRAYWRGKKL